DEGRISPTMQRKDVRALRGDVTERPAVRDIYLELPRIGRQIGQLIETCPLDKLGALISALRQLTQYAESRMKQKGDLLPEATEEPIAVATEPMAIATQAGEMVVPAATPTEDEAPFVCTTCEQELEEHDLVEVRECPHCEERF